MKIYKNISHRFRKHLSFVICHLSLFVLPLFAHAQLRGEIEKNLGLTGGESGLGQNDLATTVGSVIRAGLTLLGIVFLVLIVYAGFVWLLARGREDEIQRAQKIIETSIIGLIVVASAFAISKFIFAVVISGAGVR